MARPRKDQQEPAAVERIKNAFWELLEENDLKHITVNTVTQKAHCNRGTFYYHYESLDALLCTVIEEELLSSKGLPLGIFYMLSNDSKALTEVLLPQRMQRFGLVMKRCGQECVGVENPHHRSQHVASHPLQRGRGTHHQCADYHRVFHQRPYRRYRLPLS